MELRLGKAKEAKATAEPFAKDEQLAKSKYAKLGLYLHGFAAFQTQDYLVAGRSLAQLAPFDDPHHGLHARYLLGRIYQVTDQKAEAAQAFDAVIAGYEQQKKDAAEAPQEAGAVRQEPGRAAAAGSARPQPAAGLRAGQHLLHRVPRLRGRQVRRRARQVPGVRQGVPAVAARAGGATSRRLLPGADEVVSRSRRHACSRCSTSSRGWRTRFSSGLARPRPAPRPRSPTRRRRPTATTD